MKRLLAPLDGPPPPRGEAGERPMIVGIVNATPDSFYAASRSAGREAAVERGLRLAEEGADMLDIGGESTRPGSEPVSADEEIGRVLPVIEELAKRLPLPLSVDTCKAGVAERALSAGATALNDVTALRGDPEMLPVALRYGTVILMHMLGRPRTMQEDPRYADVVGELCGFFRERLDAFSAAGGNASRVWLDPGIGFGKTLEHNVEILRRLEEFGKLGRPLLLGASRKSFLGRLSGGAGGPLAPEQRLEGSLAVACRAAEAGVFAVRVHDAAATLRALEVFARIRGGARRGPVADR